MAEREGFEPSIGVNLYALSRGAPSATRPPLRVNSLSLIHTYAKQARSRQTIALKSNPLR